jgi:hypothetical protein
MSQSKMTKPRTCRVCGQTIDSTAKEIKAHASTCAGKETVAS